MENLSQTVIRVVKMVQFKYSNHAWGFNEEELYGIDFEKQLYAHFNKGDLDDHLALPDDLLATMQSYFERIVGNIDPNYGNYTVNSSGSITIEIKDNYTASQALKSFSDWYKLVYGSSLSYAKVLSKLVIDSYMYDEFQQNLLQRGIVASELEGPVQNDLNSTSNFSMYNTYFVLITGVVGVIVALIGIYIDSVVVYYRRFRKFLRTKRKR